MTIKHIYLPAAILLAVSASVVSAQEGQRRGPPTPPSFSDVDTSGDGVISQEELDTWSTAAREGRPQRSGDGEGRPAGMGGGQGGAGVFSRIDSDGDGSVSEAEFTAMVDNMRARRGGAQGGQGGRDRPDTPEG